MGHYKREEALSYAERWAFGRNPMYVNFDALGGDCTNYVSQCLYAGCGEMNYTPETGWFYINGYKRTASWTGVEFLFRFLTTNTKEGPRARQTSRDALLPGDVIQLGRADGVFHHSELVVSVSNGEVYIATHSADAWMRPLSTYDYASIRFLRILSYT